MNVFADILALSNIQQRIATAKSSLCSTKFHIVLQNASNKKIYSKEQL